MKKKCLFLIHNFTKLSFFKSSCSYVLLMFKLFDSPIQQTLEVFMALRVGPLVVAADTIVQLKN